MSDESPWIHFRTDLIILSIYWVAIIYRTVFFDHFALWQSICGTTMRFSEHNQCLDVSRLNCVVIVIISCFVCYTTYTASNVLLGYKNGVSVSRNASNLQETDQHFQRNVTINDTEQTERLNNHRDQVIASTPEESSKLNSNNTARIVNHKEHWHDNATGVLKAAVTHLFLG